MTTVEELRALAALELELDLLISQQVAAARKAKVPWDTIADAMGVAGPTAWRRWNDVVDYPRPTRPRRKAAEHLTLEPHAEEAVRKWTDELRKRLTDRQVARPWAAAVRRALDRQRWRYEIRELDRSRGESEFWVRDEPLLIQCKEPGPGNGGGIVVTTIPSADARIETGAMPRSAPLSTDALVPELGEKLVGEIEKLILEQLRPLRRDEANRP
jgi:hypothetical protein